MENLAIIPVKARSRRLPNKNIRNFHGKPIFLYSIEYAKKSRLFDEILVSTESLEIRDICQANGYDIPFLRPRHLADDKTRLSQVCDHVLNEYARNGKTFKNFCLLWATAPMRTDVDIRKAHEMLDQDSDAVVAVAEFEHHPYGALQMDENRFVSPLFGDKLKLNSDEVPKAMVDNASMCWVKVDSFKKHGTWLLPRMKGYVMEKTFSVEIETQDDWELAEVIYEKYFLEHKSGS